MLTHSPSVSDTHLCLRMMVYSESKEEDRYQHRGYFFLVCLKGILSCPVEPEGEKCLIIHH